MACGCDSSLSILSNPSDANEIVVVQGRVLLDEAPLSGARVTFIPISSIDGSLSDMQPMSYGITDVGGNFKLQQADGTAGAVKGQHTVLISKPIDSDSARSARGLLDSRANAVPEFYRQHGYLKQHVMPLSGGQKVDFKLSTIDPLLKDNN